MIKTLLSLVSMFVLSLPALATDEGLEIARAKAVFIHAAPALSDDEVSMILTEEANRRAAKNQTISAKHLRYDEKVKHLVSRGVSPAVFQFEEIPPKTVKKPERGETKPQKPEEHIERKGTLTLNQ